MIFYDFLLFLLSESLDFLAGEKSVFILSFGVVIGDWLAKMQG